MEHTAEPWEWSEHKFNAPPFEGTLEHECGIYPVPDGEICANARLIAAAPDLLEVCRRLSHVSLFAVDEDVASIIMRACDAVSKAIGGKP